MHGFRNIAFLVGLIGAIASPVVAAELAPITGTIENLDEPAYNHTNIDNAVPLQDASTAAILQVLRPSARAGSR
jgi:hypothetical protein